MEEGRLEESLDALVCAYNLDPNPKTSQRINRLRDMLASCSSQKETQESSASVPTVELTGERFYRLKKQARILFQNKDYRGTLDLLLQADELCPSDKLKRRIGRLRDLMDEEEKKEEGEKKKDEVTLRLFNLIQNVLMRH